ncbi:glycosyltransferase family 4 protein [Deinococcus geothermalis]|uniref:glycosyltransferase family 4 protein n=1 Tax=Deinococcus geothermalis TaxID=68909 RepID=UPI002353D32E|nr:glycosyltransferase family 1 protein [Deinococcus geothermalis]
MLSGEGLLWSPANTGPLKVRRQVVTMHDAATLDHPEWFERKFAAWYRFLLPRLANRVQRVITVSEYSRHRLVAQTGIPHSKVTVIPLAADARFRTYERPALEAALRIWGLSETPYLLAVGSLEPRKNLGTLFQAWEAWEGRPVGLQLAVVGAGNKVFSGAGFGQVPQGVNLLGRVSDEVLPLLYAGAEAFLYPSLYEGFGLPPLEAMASGTPVVTSNVTSLPEVVGDAALTVDPRDALALRDAMRRVVTDTALASELRVRGLHRAAHYSWEKTAAHTWEILQQEANK